jgi:multidrug resistance efflux pump
LSARNRVFFILALLTVGSLVWYLLTTPRSKELQLIGTVDANEVVVSSRITGRLQTLTVKEGDHVQAGQLIGTIEADDLDAALKAAEAAAASSRWHVSEAQETERQTRGETSGGTAAAEAQIKAAQATLQQAEAQLAHQKAETTRTVALAGQGIMSAQARDEATTAMQASEAAVHTAQGNLAAAQAALRQAQAHELLNSVTARTVDANRASAANAQALAAQARVEQSYAEITAPLNAIVNIWAARQGEVVTVGEPIVTLMDLSQTWVYAPLPETYADAVKLGDSLRVVMPSGAAVWGKVIAKMTEADFATQRDVSTRKRDIKTVQLKLLIPNPGDAYVPGMTAEVYVPQSKLVKQ